MILSKNELFATLSSGDEILNYCNKFCDSEKVIAFTCAMIAWNTAVELFNKPFTSDEEHEVETILSAIKEMESRYNLNFTVNQFNQIEVEVNNSSTNIYDLAELFMRRP